MDVITQEYADSYVFLRLHGKDGSPGAAAARSPSPNRKADSAQSTTDRAVAAAALVSKQTKPTERMLINQFCSEGALIQHLARRIPMIDIGSENFAFKTFVEGGFGAFLDKICSDQEFSSVENRTLCFETDTRHDKNCYYCGHIRKDGQFCRKGKVKEFEPCDKKKNKMCLFNHSECECEIKNGNYLCLQQLFKVCSLALSLPKSLGILL